MHVDWVVPHAEVSEADAHAITGLDHEVLMQSDTSLLRADWIEVMNKMLGDRPIFYSPRKMDFDNE